MRLVACRACHAQYDVTHVGEPVFECRCGQAVRNEALAAIDAAIARCSSCGALLPDGAPRCEYCQAAVERDGAALSLICPECFARNAEAARFCTGCGVAFQPEPLPDEREEPPACPCCEEPMGVRGVGGVWVRECPKCNGLWVPGERLDALIQRAIETARQRAASGAAGAPLRPREVSRAFAYRTCPLCRARMHRKNFGKRSGVIIDWCGPHGTWLDRDELEQIGAFIAGGGLRDAEGGAAAPGLSTGGRLSVEQFKAMAIGERMIAEERARQERRSSWLESRPGSGHSGLDLVIHLLGRLLD